MRNLRHLTQLTAACTEPFMRFDLDYNVRQTAPAVHTGKFVLVHPVGQPSAI